MVMSYNPFSKPFEEIVVYDLSILFKVSEGWYVEYKRELSSSTKIAKSLTAFANTYGGWLFFGVDEKGKDLPFAGAFTGIPADEADTCLQQIRQAAANHCQPSPFFQVKALFGPCDPIGLAAGRCVIVVHIPWGPEAPYIHKDGVIYRRVGDGSEPKSENDRFVLDRLWKRSDPILTSIDKWVNAGLELSKGEEGSAYLQIFFIHDFWKSAEEGVFLDSRYIKEQMRDSEGPFSLLFDNIYETNNGVISRQINGGDPSSLGLTWKTSWNADSELIIPLRKIHFTEINDAIEWLKGYDKADEFIDILKHQRYEYGDILDLNILFYTLMGVARTAIALLKKAELNSPLYLKMKLTGVWRTIPFVDSEHFMSVFRDNGIPLILRDELLIFDGKHIESFLEWSFDPEMGVIENMGSLATQLFIPIARELGVPFPLKAEDTLITSSSLMKQIFKAGDNALEVQNARKRRKPIQN
ncbi:ATP-binding protein [Corticibacterium sp. UT-5YL-CI-8]|nr:ATP-binding protein [Tianweitania sp. UT-5YL-CI-8]